MKGRRHVEADDPWARRRRAMVEKQLRARGIADARVLAAMEEVPRHEFVPPALRSAAYDDGPLPIGAGQTISQPTMVALMLEAMELDGSERVLEVGTGSGYEAALLSRLAAAVFTLEIVPELAARARETLARLGYANVEVIEGDGSLGWPAAAPYDAIVVAAGAPEIPAPLVAQLAEGGRLVIPVGYGFFGQTLLRVRRGAEGSLEQEDLGLCAFVPLLGEHGVKPTGG